MANGNIKLRKPMTDKALNITISVTKEYRVRLWLACRLLEVFGFLLGVNECNINLNPENDYPEGWISHKDLVSKGKYIVDAKGNMMLKVRAYKELENSILVKVLMTNDDNEYMSQHDAPVEFEAELWGAKVMTANG